jgi:hypothetical protein
MSREFGVLNNSNLIIGRNDFLLNFIYLVVEFQIVETKPLSLRIRRLTLKKKFKLKVR